MENLEAENGLVVILLTLAKLKKHENTKEKPGENVTKGNTVENVWKPTDLRCSLNFRPV